MSKLFEAVAKINSLWSLSACGIVAILLLAVHFFKKDKSKMPIVYFVGSMIFLICLSPIIASLFIKPEIYRVRINVINEMETPIESAKVWSTLGGEVKKVSFGWEVDIPEANVAKNRKLSIYAEETNAFLKGKVEIKLENDHSLNTIIKLIKNNEAFIRGRVIDDKGNSIFGAIVFIEGYGSEKTFTDSTGSFVLKAHAAFDQQVALHAEKKNKKADLYFPAGITTATLQIK